jgi:hypothetical protein
MPPPIRGKNSYTDPVQTHSSANTPEDPIHHSPRLSFSRLSQSIKAVADGLASAIEKKFAGSLKDNVQSLFKRSPSSGAQASKRVRLANLLGKTIDPKTATELLDHFRFDHTGKLLGHKGKLSAQNLSLLEQGVLSQSLSQTNSKADRDVSRTDREILLDLANALQQAKQHASSPQLASQLDQSLDKVKSLWLHYTSKPSTSKPTMSASSGLLESLAQDLHTDAPELSKYIASLFTESLKPKAVTQIYDNAFGRKFESEFVFALAQSTPPGIKSSAAKTGRWLFEQIQQLPKDEKSAFIKKLAENLAHNPRPWHAETPDIGAFIAKPNIDTLQAMLEPDRFSGFDVIKMSCIGVEASLLLQPPFMQQANYNYAAVVDSARSQVFTAGSGSLKLQTEAISKVVKDLTTLFQARVQASGNLEAVEAQYYEVRDLIDQMAYSIRTPRELSQKLLTLEAQFRSRGDVDVANTLLGYANTFASDPNPDHEYAIVEARADDVDMSRVKDTDKAFTPPQTKGYGTNLIHQRSNLGGDNWGSGKSVQSFKTLNTSQIKSFDKKTLEQEMNSVSGPSGSTNIMIFMYLEMQKTDPTLNLEDAFAGTMMFLTLDGGHSLPESIGTFSAIKADTRPTMTNKAPNSDAGLITFRRSTVLDHFSLEYGKLATHFSNPQTAAAVRTAVETAWEKSLGAFGQIHQERLA